MRQRVEHLSALTEAEHGKLVGSAVKIKRSVVKLVQKETSLNKVETIGTAFLVHMSGDLSLFLSCNHNIGDQDPDSFVVRFMEEREIAALECKINVIAQDKDSDLLLFSVKGGPAGLEPLVFSMEPIKIFDKVAVIGYSYMVVPELCKKMLIINEPSIMTGRMVVDSFETKVRKTIHVAKSISDTRCMAGNSGSPVLRDGQVIAVHGGSDATWRESIPAGKVLTFLRRHLKKKRTKSTVVQLLQEIADAAIAQLLQETADKETDSLISKLKREDAPQTSNLNRVDDREKEPETSNSDRWKGNTFTRLKHRRPGNVSADRRDV